MKKKVKNVYLFEQIQHMVNFLLIFRVINATWISKFCLSHIEEHLSLGGEEGGTHGNFLLNSFTVSSYS